MDPMSTLEIVYQFGLLGMAIIAGIIAYKWAGHLQSLGGTQ